MLGLLILAVICLTYPSISPTGTKIRLIIVQIKPPIGDPMKVQANFKMIGNFCELFIYLLLYYITLIYI